MKAVVATAYGGPEVLDIKEVERPVPGEKDILVRIKASAITGAGMFMREGTPKFGRLFIGLTKPKAATPGTDLAGIVEEVGSAVFRFKVGDEIISMTDTNMGAHAEYITITEEEVIALVARHRRGRRKKRKESFQEGCTKENSV